MFPESLSLCAWLSSNLAMLSLIKFMNPPYKKQNQNKSMASILLHNEALPMNEKYWWRRQFYCKYPQCIS